MTIRHESVDAYPQAEPSNRWGIWSAIGLAILIGVAVYLVKPDWSVFANLWEFLTGHVDKVTNGRIEPLSQVVSVVLLFLAVCIVVPNALNFIQERIFGTVEEQDIDIFAAGGAVILLVIIGEEVFARLLFLGLLTKVFQGPVAFYILLLLGNGIWAGLHLYNFKGTKNPVIVLPHFLMGLLFGYLFVRYGFWVTLWVHVVYDGWAFSFRKKTPPSLVDIFALLYAVAGLTVTIILLHINNLGFADLAPWVTSTARDFPLLKGFGFWDYALLLLALNFGAGVIADVLLLDNVEPVLRNNTLLRYLGDLVLNVLIILGINYLLGGIVPDAITRVVIISMISVIAKTATSKSGSAFSRTILLDFPVIFLVIGAITALGVVASVFLLLLFGVVGIVPQILQIVRQELIRQGQL